MFRILGRNRKKAALPQILGEKLKRLIIALKILQKRFKTNDTMLEGCMKEWKRTRSAQPTLSDKSYDEL